MIFEECYDYCKDGQFIKLIRLFNSPASENINKLRDEILNSETSLFAVAAQNDHLDILEYLYNQSLNPKYENGTSTRILNEMVSSLEIAVQAKKWKIIDYILITKPHIVKKWASFKRISSLCIKEEIDILKRFIHFGYNINIREDSEGGFPNDISNHVFGSCSINVIRLFLENADKLGLNMHKNKSVVNCSCFNEALRRNDLAIVKLFLEFDVTKVSPYKNKLIPYMEWELDESIVDYLLASDKFTEYEKIEALEIYGAILADGTVDIKVVRPYWERALNKRQELNYPKDNLVSKSNAFHNKTEFSTLRDLNKVATGSAYWQSILIHERLLGPNNPTSINRFKSRAYDLFSDGNLKKSFMLYLHILENLKAFESPFYCAEFQFFETAFSAFSCLEKLNIKVLHQNFGKNNACRFRFQDILCWYDTPEANGYDDNVFIVLHYSLKIIKIIYEHLEYIIQRKGAAIEERGVNILVYICKVLSRIVFHEAYTTDLNHQTMISQLKTNLAKILELKSKEFDGRSVVFSTFQIYTDKTEQFYTELKTPYNKYDEYLFIRLLDLFIECKIDPNMKSPHNDEQLLHVISELVCSTLTDEAKTDDETTLFNENAMLQKFIDYGAHLDAVNSEGYCAFDIMRQQGINATILKPKLSLQCLCARVIRKNDKLMKSESIPAYLRDFISIH